MPDSQRGRSERWMVVRKSRSGHCPDEVEERDALPAARSTALTAYDDKERVLELIGTLEEEGDIETLQEGLSHVNILVDGLAKRHEFADKMAEYFELKIKAEAALGEILTREGPPRPRDKWPSHLEIAPRWQRDQWRALATASRRSALDKAIRLAIENGSFSTAAVIGELRSAGALRVPEGALREPIERCGLSMREIARRANVDEVTVRALAGRATSSRAPRSLVYQNSARVASVIGIEPTTLPRAKMPHPPRRRTRHWLGHRYKPSGSPRLDAAYNDHVKARTSFHKLFGDDKYDEIYEHFYAIEDFYKRELAREYGKR